MLRFKKEKKKKKKKQKKNVRTRWNVCFWGGWGDIYEAEHMETWARNEILSSVVTLQYEHVKCLHESSASTYTTRSSFRI